MKRIDIVPTLIVGIGGIGGQIVNEVKGLVQKKTGDKDFPAIKFLCINSTMRDYEQLPDKYLDPNSEILLTGFDPNELKTIFENPEAYRVPGGDADLSEIITEWYKNYFKKAIEEILEGCGGFPIVCRVSFLRDHFERVSVKLENLLKTLNNVDEINRLLTERFGDKYYVSKVEKGGVKINVYVVTSLAGGTGRGLYEQINVLIKNVARKLGLNFNQIRLRFFVILPVQLKGIDLPFYAQVNTYAGLKEINIFQEKKYRTENYTLELYKVNGLNAIEDFVGKEGIADQICLISSSYENGDFVAKDFSEFTKKIAGFITDSIFDGFQNTLLARESNLENILSRMPKVFDIEAKRERGRYYSRPLYSSMYFPYDNVVKFISGYTLKVLLEDIRFGSLPSKKRNLDKGNLKENIKSIGHQSVNFISDKLNDILIKVKGIPGEINDINAINQIIEDISLINTTLEHLKSNIYNLEKVNDAVEEILQTSLNTESRIIADIKTYISDYGGIEGFINFLNYIMETFLEEILKYSKHITTTELIETLEDESKYRKIIQDITEKITSVQHSLSEYMAELNSIKASTEAGLKRIIKFIFRDIDEETREKTRAVIESFKTKIHEFVDDVENDVNTLRTYITYHFLKALIENFRKKDEVVKAIEKGVWKDIENQVFATYEGVKKLFLNSIEEGIVAYTFYNNLLKSEGRKTLEETYDERIENTQIYNNIASYIFNFESFRKELENVLNKFRMEIEENFKAKFEDGLSFLNTMLSPANRELLENQGDKNFDIERMIRKWIKNEDFWGVIDTSRASSSEVINQRDTKVILLIMPKKYENIEKVITETLGDMNIEFREAPEEELSKDSVKIMGMHYGLPLFVFHTVRSMKELYMKLKKSERPRYHIAEWFIYEEEPVGQSYGAGAEDLAYLIVLAYALGAIKGNLKDPRDIIQKFSFIMDFTLKCKYEPLKVGNISVRTDTDIDEMSPHSRYLIIEEIKKAIVERYIYLVDKFKDDEKEQEILKNFLSSDIQKLSTDSGFIVPMKDSLKALLEQKLETYRKANFRLDLVSKINKWLKESETGYADYSLVDEQIRQLIEKDDFLERIESALKVYKPEENECN